MAKTRQGCKVKIGLDEFIDMAFANKSVDAKVICPCKKCGEESSVAIKVAKDHPNSVGSTVGYAKIVRSKVTSIVSSESQTSDENQMKVVEENVDLELFKDFVERSLHLGVKGKELNDSITSFLNLKGGEKDSDKSVSMLLEFSNELSEEGADPSRSFSEMVTLLGEEQHKKAPRRKQTQASALTSSGCEEEGRIASGEKQNQPSASTSSGSTGYSPKEENRRKLREKINQRRVSRSPSVR